MPYAFESHAKNRHWVNNAQIITNDLEFEEISNEVSEKISGGISFYSRQFPQLPLMLDKIQKNGDDENTIVKNYESPDGLVKTTEVIKTSKYVDYHVS
jgi:hypothetical protein